MTLLAPERFALRSEVLLDTKRGRFVTAVRMCDFRCRLQHDCCNLVWQSGVTFWLPEVVKTKDYRGSLLRQSCATLLILLLRFDQLLTGCNGCSFGAVRDTELRKNRLQVVFYGDLLDVELVGDFLIVET